MCACAIPLTHVGEARDLESGGASFGMRITQALVLASKVAKGEVLIEVLTTNREVLTGSGPRVSL